MVQLIDPTKTFLRTQDGQAWGGNETLHFSTTTFRDQTFILHHDGKLIMVQGLKFLSKKGFNPQNQSNRKQVWEAQQASKQEQERIRRREEQLKRERDDEEICRANHNGDGSQAQLRFMYDAPPGMKKRKEEVKDKALHKTTNDVTQIQPGDDPAAAVFRRLLASSTQQSSQQSEESARNDNTESKMNFGAVLQGSTMDPLLEKTERIKEGDARSALEKAVGRKDRGGALTLEEQIARFPQLKNAPMAKGMNATDVNVSFKPLGSQMRNVRCLACGIWGHSRGDRECEKTGWNPFAVQKPVISVVPNNSINNHPSSKTKVSEHRRKRSYDEYDERSFSSGSTSEDSRRKRKRKSKKKKKKKRHKESKRHRRRRSHSESPVARKRHSRII